FQNRLLARREQDRGTVLINSPPVGCREQRPQQTVRIRRRKRGRNPINDEGNIERAIALLGDLGGKAGQQVERILLDVRIAERSSGQPSLPPSCRPGPGRGGDWRDAQRNREYSRGPGGGFSGHRCPPCAPVRRRPHPAGRRYRVLVGSTKI